MSACFDTISKGMDTVPTRFDALQFKIYSHAENQRFFYRSDTAMPRSFHNQLLVNS